MQFVVSATGEVFGIRIPIEINPQTAGTFQQETCAAAIEPVEVATQLELYPSRPAFTKTGRACGHQPLAIVGVRVGGKLPRERLRHQRLDARRGH